MSEITFLASSKPFSVPQEIQELDEQAELRAEDYMCFSVSEATDYWLQQVHGLFSLPYIYEAKGIESRLFLTYLEKHMEIGDVLEVYSVPNQHEFPSYKKKLQENPESVEVNTGSYTYRDPSSLYQLNPKKWVEELSHRSYVNHYGITTFIKYS